MSVLNRPNHSVDMVQALQSNSPEIGFDKNLRRSSRSALIAADSAQNLLYESLQDMRFYGGRLSMRQIDPPINAIDVSRSAAECAKAETTLLYASNGPGANRTHRASR